MNSNECDSDIYSSLKILKKLKKSISSLKNEIDNENDRKKKIISNYKQELADCEMNLSLFKEELLLVRKEICSKSNTLISVSLGDLVHEISKLSGINGDNIRVKLDTDIELLGVHSENEMFNLFNQVDGDYNIVLLIEGGNVNKSSLITYLTRIPLDNELKEINKGLLGHCSRKIVNNFGKVYTRIVLDKDINDIILNFRLYHLDKLESYSWFPSELFTQAVVNCLSKANKKAKKKTKELN